MTAQPPRDRWDERAEQMEQHRCSSQPCEDCTRELAAALRAAFAEGKAEGSSEEREECAKMADRERAEWGGGGTVAFVCYRLAEAIRDRTRQEGVTPTALTGGGKEP